MQYRKFGSTDLVVSEIGFGAWAIGGGAMIGNTAIGWGDADDQQSIQAIHAALDAGITFFDTADIYGLGHSEELLGKVLSADKGVIIASKVGNVARNGQFTTDYTASHIRSACEASLVRLKREQIDYYQLHTARLHHIQEGECVEMMQKLQQEGKIRFWGASLNTFDPLPEANFLMQQQMGSGFQGVLNIINQRALPVLKTGYSQGFGFIARMPLQFGLLTGKFNSQTLFPENDHRKQRVTPEIIEAVRQATATIWSMCESYACTKAQLALGYVLSYPEVSVVIPGIRTTAHVAGNTGNLIRMSLTDRTRIENLRETVMEPLMEKIRLQG